MRDKSVRIVRVHATSPQARGGVGGSVLGSGGRASSARVRDDRGERWSLVPTPLEDTAQHPLSIVIVYRGVLSA